ncbi:retrovirus-related pol polyprotein from transposon TNT 1-94 [Tanacetum coccineum]
MTGDRCQLTNFVNKFLGTVKFGNDHMENIMGYGDYQIGNVTISKVYYVEGLGHNLFSVRQFCDSNLEVAFRQHTCFVRNLEGVDLLTGSRGNNLCTLSLGDMMASSLICLLSKALKTKSWLWHRRLSHLNFGTINQLARHGLVRAQRNLTNPNLSTNQEKKLYLLHMDLCGPMRVASVNGKKYILVIVDDYSRFTWIKFLRSKDEAPDFIIKFLKMIQKVGISHETSVARSPQQNGVVERRNRTLIEAARTMLIYAKAPLFLWAEAVATASDAMASESQQFMGPALHEKIMTPANNQFRTHVKPSSFNTVFAPKPVVSTGSPSSTTVDQDAPSPKDNHDIEVAHMGNDVYFGILIPEVSSDQSSSSDIIHTILHEQALVCYYDAFLTAVEPKTYKDALTQSCWIEATARELIWFGMSCSMGARTRPDKLKKALYGLKQAPRAWYDMLSSFMISQDFSKGSVDPTLFIPISQSPRGIFINQSKYALKSLKKYDFDSCDPVDTPMVEKSKLDEDKEGKVVDHQLSWYDLAPPYLQASRHDTINLAICMSFADADHAGCQDTRRSTSSSMQFLGDRLVSWSSKKVESAALSSTKVIYCFVWLLSKHIDIRFYFIKEHVENGVIELYFVNTEYQLADIFTKALGRERIEFQINKLGMQSFTPETLEQLADEVDE